LSLLYGLILDEKKPDDLLKIGIFMTIPFVLAVPPMVGWVIGKWLDDYFGTGNKIMYVFLILGLIAGFRELFRIIKKYGNGNET